MSIRMKKQEEKSTFKETAAFIMGTFSLVVLCVFPLIYHDFYFDILETKYQFYCGAVGLMLAAMLLAGLMKGSLLAYFRNFNLKVLIKSLSIVDWAMLAFWLFNVISWLLCFEWHWEAFWGTSGRYNGAFLMTIYMLVYFLMTRYFRFQKWYLDAFLAVGILVSAFGITDYFQMDILHFKERMNPAQLGSYTSTLGNINTYTVYIGAMLVVSTVLFALEKNLKRMAWYLAIMVLASFALIMGTSDNAYLTLAALYGFAPLFLFRTKRGLSRYLISVAVFFTAILGVSLINNTYADKVFGIVGIFNLITKFEKLPVIVLVLWLLAGFAVFFAARQKEGDGALPKFLVYGWTGVIVLVIAVVVFVLYDANVAGNAERYSAISSYAVFNDEWGTGRGYVWRRSIELYNTQLTPLQKLFGYGPDTFKLLMQVNNDFRMQGGKAIIFDSAHNEYLHYLITIGIAGMSSYFIFMSSAVVRMCRRMKDAPHVAAAMLVVAAYMTQALVNINLPIVMPIIINILSMGLSEIPNEEWA